LPGKSKHNLAQMTINLAILIDKASEIDKLQSISQLAQFLGKNEEIVGIYMSILNKEN